MGLSEILSKFDQQNRIIKNIENARNAIHESNLKSSKLQYLEIACRKKYS
jgi:hypothetical protein